MSVRIVTEGFDNARDHELNSRYLVTSRGDKVPIEFSPHSGLTAGSAQRARQVFPCYRCGMPSGMTVRTIDASSAS
jgi:hypothetical protein